MGNSESFHCPQKENKFEKYGLKDLRIHVHKHSLLLVEDENTLNGLLNNFKISNDRYKGFDNLSEFFRKQSQYQCDTLIEKYIYEYVLSIHGKKGPNDVEISLSIKLIIEKDINGFWFGYNHFESLHPFRFDYKKNNQSAFLWSTNEMNKIEAYILDNIPYIYLDRFYQHEVLNLIEKYISKERNLVYPDV